MILESHGSCTCIYYIRFWFSRSCCESGAVTPWHNTIRKRVFYYMIRYATMSNFSHEPARSVVVFPEAPRIYYARGAVSPSSLHYNADALPLRFSLSSSSTKYNLDNLKQLNIFWCYILHEKKEIIFFIQIKNIWCYNVCILS